MTRLFQLTALAGAALITLSSAGLAGEGEPKNAKAHSPRALASTACFKLPKLNVAQSNTSQTTTSNVNSQVVGSLVNFAVAGTNNSCVIVTFSAQAFAPSGRLMHVSILLDGTTQSLGDQIQFVADSGTFSDAHSYTFIFPSVAPGAHSLVAQYRSQTSGDAVTINDFQIVVQHK